MNRRRLHRPILIDIETHVEPALKFVPPQSSSNQILAALPAHEYGLLAASMTECELQAGQVLQSLHQSASSVWFPNSGLISLRAEITPGTGLEVALIGNDGVAGIAATDTPLRSPLSAMVQIGGVAMRIDVDHFHALSTTMPVLKKLLCDATEKLLLQTAQSAVCSHYHLLEARLARMLLLIRRSVAMDEFHLTHEFISHALGVRRVGVTKAATSLQMQQLIRYSRGAISIIDVAGLAQAACPCYRSDPVMLQSKPTKKK